MFIEESMKEAIYYGFYLVYCLPLEPGIPTKQ